MTLLENPQFGLCNFSVLTEIHEKGLSQSLFTEEVNMFSVTKRGFFTIVQQSEVMAREFLGVQRTIVGPGIRLRLPFLHKVQRVDLREGSEMLELQCFTKDNVPVHVEGTLFYKVFDPEKACFSVQNYLESVCQVGASSVRSVFGRLEYDKIIAERNVIISELVNVVGNSIHDWGVTCTRFEVQGFGPVSKEVARQLELQMEAERKRRENEINMLALVKTAEAQKVQAILKSEGELQSQKNVAEANFVATQRKADAEKYSQDMQLAATRTQLEELTKLLGSAEKASDFLIKQAQLNRLANIAKSSGHQTYFVPDGGLLPVSQTKMAGDLLEVKNQ